MFVAKFLAPLAFAAFMVVGLALALDDALSLPQVYKSHSTGECVEMVVIDRDHPKGVACPEVLPTRYDLVWVQ